MSWYNHPVTPKETIKVKCGYTTVFIPNTPIRYRITKDNEMLEKAFIADGQDRDPIKVVVAKEAKDLSDIKTGKIDKYKAKKPIIAGKGMTKVVDKSKTKLPKWLDEPNNDNDNDNWHEKLKNFSPTERKPIKPIEPIASVQEQIGITDGSISRDSVWEEAEEIGTNHLTIWEQGNDTSTYTVFELTREDSIATLKEYPRLKKVALEDCEAVYEKVKPKTATKRGMKVVAPDTFVIELIVGGQTLYQMSARKLPYKLLELVNDRVN